MKHCRSTFRRRRSSACNAAYFGYRALFRDAVTKDQRKAVEDQLRAARMLCTTAPQNLPGETNRQLATRLRAEAAAAEAPTKAKTRKKAAA